MNEWVRATQPLVDGGAAKTLATRELLREIRRLRALLASASGRTVTVLSL
jgi:hypothetical protein